MALLNYYEKLCVQSCYIAFKLLNVLLCFKVM